MSIIAPALILALAAAAAPAAGRADAAGPAVVQGSRRGPADSLRFRYQEGDSLGSYDYGYYYDPYTDTWQYGLNRRLVSPLHDRYYDPYVLGRDHGNDIYADAGPGRTGPQGRRLWAEVIGMKRLEARDGRPASLQLEVRTTDGRRRTLQLGDLGYARANLPLLPRGSRVTVVGREFRRGGRSYFQAYRIVNGRGESFDIPSYAYGQTLSGRLLGLRRVRVGPRGRVRAVVARLRTPAGRVVDVRLGARSAAGRQAFGLRRGSTIAVVGYTRAVGDSRIFEVQRIEPLTIGQRQRR